MSEIIGWLQIYYQEIIGTILSLVYLYLSIIQNKWLWPLGLVSSAMYTYIFLKAGIYADMGLQIYYVIISVYGWFVWIDMQKEKKNSSATVKSLSKLKLLPIWLLIFTSIVFIVLSQILVHFTDSTVPYIDAFTTALSITATWMLARKIIEHWILWIVVDLVSSGVYYVKGLYVTIFLYIVYTIFAVVGYLFWLKSYRIYRDGISQNNSLAF